MKPQNEKKRFNLFLAIFGFIILGVIVLIFLNLTLGTEQINAHSILSIIIGLMIIATALYFIIKRKKEIDQGVPQYNERIQKIMYLSAARAFYISIYWFLLLMWLVDTILKEMPSSALIGIGIGGMAIIWIICQFWYNKYGDKHI
jgi:LPXTG-motif cell wall-anchored protein